MENSTKIAQEQQTITIELLNSIVKNKEIYDESTFNTLKMSLITISKELNNTITKTITGNLNEEK